MSAPYERRKPAAAPAKGPKIIVQYRAKDAKVYELQSDGAVLAVRISQAEREAVPSAWRVDAQSGSEPGAAVEGSGTTAAEALKEVARAWKAHYPALKTFDWEAIARELHVVQAI
jgi:hypothetical protein